MKFTSALLAFLIPNLWLHALCGRVFVCVCLCVCNNLVKEQKCHFPRVRLVWGQMEISRDRNIIYIALLPFSSIYHRNNKQNDTSIYIPCGSVLAARYRRSLSLPRLSIWTHLTRSLTPLHFLKWTRVGWIKHGIREHIWSTCYTSLQAPYLFHFISEQ